MYIVLFCTVVLSARLLTSWPSSWPQNKLLLTLSEPASPT